MAITSQLHRFPFVLLSETQHGSDEAQAVGEERKAIEVWLAYGQELSEHVIQGLNDSASYEDTHATLMAVECPYPSLQKNAVSDVLRAFWMGPCNVEYNAFENETPKIGEWKHCRDGDIEWIPLLKEVYVYPGSLVPSEGTIRIRWDDHLIVEEFPIKLWNEEDGRGVLFPRPKAWKIPQNKRPSQEPRFIPSVLKDSVFVTDQLYLVMGNDELLWEWDRLGLFWLSSLPDSWIQNYLNRFPPSLHSFYHNQRHLHRMVLLFCRAFFTRDVLAKSLNQSPHLTYMTCLMVTAFFHSHPGREFLSSISDDKAPAYVHLMMINVAIALRHDFAEELPDGFIGFPWGRDNFVKDVLTLTPAMGTFLEELVKPYPLKSFEI